MLKNYFNIAVRNLVKYKAYSLINILGLSIGLASSILILLYILDEVSYDQHFKNKERIYRLTLQTNTSQGVTHSAMTPSGWAADLVKDFSEIEQVVRIKPPNQMWKVDYKDLSFYERGWAFADPSVFNTFSWNIIETTAEVPLSEPFTVMISQKMIRKYFPEENPVGKKLILDNVHQFEVTGIIEDLPANSHFKFDFLASLGTLNNPIYGQDFLNIQDVPVIYTYLKLISGTDADKFGSKLPGFIKKVLGEQMEQTGIKFTTTLQPVTAIHLDSHLEDEIQINGDIRTIRMFGIVDLFILLIASINFMNLSTARSLRRAKEISMRKVVGAQKRQLILQFIFESVVITLIAMVIALVIVIYALPLFKILIDKDIHWTEIFRLNLMIIIVISAVSIGILAGIYPALFLSGFNPLQTLKGKINTKTSSPAYLRKVLIVVQFTISIFLIICTVILYNQLGYIRNRNLGFTKENVVVLQLSDEVLREYYPELKDSLLQQPGIINVSASSSAPAELSQQFAANFPLGFKTSMRPKNSPSNRNWQVDIYAVDYDFFSTLNLQILAGRKISPDVREDSTGAYIINETAAREFGWENPENAVGEEIVFADDVNNLNPFKIIGIVNDFHIQSGHEKIVPLVIRYFNPQSYFFALIRITGDNLPNTLSSIAASWKNVMPDYPFEYSFLDQNFDKLYNAEKTLSRLLTYFSILAIIIACLGLFGLTSYTIESRIREVGIRKVLGASFRSLLILLTREYTLLVLAAFIFGAPLAYISMNLWLTGFAYHIDIQWFHFLISGVFFLLVALGTVGFKSFKAANKNPTEILKVE